MWVVCAVGAAVPPLSLHGLETRRVLEQEDLAGSRFRLGGFVDSWNQWLRACGPLGQRIASRVSTPQVFLGEAEPAVATGGPTGAGGGTEASVCLGPRALQGAVRICRARAWCRLGAGAG